MPAGTGAVATTVQSELRKTVSPENFGAVGNGVANDAAAVTAALTYSLSSGVRFQGKGGSRYLLDSVGAIILQNTSQTPVVIDWGGSEVIFKESSIVIRSASSSPILTTSLATNPLRGDAKLVLASVTGIQQGDLVEINSPALMHSSIKAQHYYVVSEVDGTDVYIEGNVCGDVNPQQVTDTGQSGSIVVNVYRLAVGVVVQNGSFKAIDVNGDGGVLSIQRHFRAVTDNLIVSGHTRAHLAFNYCGHTLSTRIYCRDFGYIDKDRGYSSLPTDPSGLAFGYGITLARNYSSVVRDCVGAHGWHFSDVAVGQMHALFDNVITHRNGYGLQSHGGVWNAVYKNCEFRGKDGLGCEGVNHVTIEGCRFIHTRVHGITNGSNVSFVAKNNYFLIDNPDFTNYAVFRASATPVSAGAVSANDVLLYEFSNNTVLGRTLVALGANNIPGLDSVLKVSGNLMKKVSVGVIAQKQTFITNNQIEGVQQFAFMLTSSGAAPDIITVDGNVVTGQHYSGGSGYMVYVLVQAARIAITNNKNSLSAFANFSGTLTVHNISGNVHFGTGFLLDAENTITVSNLVYNQYQQNINYQAVITNNFGNVDMA